MMREPSLPGCKELQALLPLLDECLASDVPRFEKRLRQLQRRCRQGKPVDRSLAPLRQEIENSRAKVTARCGGVPALTYPARLPIIDRREDVLDALNSHQVVVLCGETGSGKTTQLPKLCLEAGRGIRGKIGHTQPRRIAARSLASRIAEELGSQCGHAVGYKVRFHDRTREDSYIKVMTDGILLAEIQADRDLREYDTLIIDEAHERSLNIDFILGYLRLLLPRRPDLKLIVTSATIDPLKFSRHFSAAPVLEVSGRSYPVEIRYRPLSGEDDEQKDRDRGQGILDAVDELAREGTGDILVFLPGERAIRETSELLRKHHPQATQVLPLYARLSASQQSEVFRPHGGRRIVLATNVAETSLTVPGIHYVVDTGLARISRYSYRTKVQRLPIEAVSQASANQRSGRCGRVAAGVCIRLYSEDDYQARDEFTAPEIHRTSLASVILQMASLGLGQVETFPFLDPPDARMVRDGYRLLHELGAVDGDQSLTDVGRQQARLPLDPRIGRMILAGASYGCLGEILVIAAALSVIDPRERPHEHAQAADEKQAVFRHDKSDFLGYMKLWDAWIEQKKHLSQNKLRKWCREHFLSFLRMREWQEVHRQLSGIAADMRLPANNAPADYRSIHSALIAGLLGNIAFNSEDYLYQGARNLKLRIFPGSGVRKSRPKWLVAAELIETGQQYLRTVAAIQPEWVERQAAHLVKRNYLEPHWEKRAGKVAAFERVTLYGLTLVNRRKVDYGPVDPEASRSLLIRHALVRGETVSRLEFVARNRALIDEVERIESKSRRRDVLVDEEEIYRFFDERIPADIVDMQKLECWWKKQSDGELLCLQREMLMQHNAGHVTQAQFPDVIEVRGLRLPASYHFSPGDELDGLRVRIPAVALRQLNPEDFDWLVPGLVQEKVTLLIKSLPKQLRRNFVPAPRFAEAFLQSVKARHGNLLTALSDRLQRMTGIEVPPDSWRCELLPPHLFAGFEITDSRGAVLAQGRDLVALQEKYATSPQPDHARGLDERFTRRDVRDWDFGELPEFIEVESQGVTLRMFPALSLSGERIDLCLFDTREEADTAHQEGLLTLFRLGAGRVVREVSRAAPRFQQQCLWFSSIGSAEVLRKDLEDAVLRQVFLGDSTVRDPGEFERRLAEGKPRIVSVSTEVGRHSLRTLEVFHDLRKVLKGRLPAVTLAAATETGVQLGKLVYPGFLAATPPRWLPHLARYLEAASKRLEKVAANPARDRKHSLLVAGLEDRWQKALQLRPGDSQIAEFRWYIEELRVSLFAQELGTAMKVSPQRLEQRWSEIR